MQNVIHEKSQRQIYEREINRETKNMVSGRKNAIWERACSHSEH